MPQAELTAGGVRVNIVHFDMNPDGIEVSNPEVAAALMCRSQYWGNVGADRSRGPQFEFLPAILGAVDVQFKPQQKMICVIFVLKGEPGDLRVRRVRFHSGELYIPDKKEFKTNWKMLDNIVAENREKAAKKLRELIAGGAL